MSSVSLLIPITFPYHLETSWNETIGFISADPEISPESAGRIPTIQKARSKSTPTNTTDTDDPQRSAESAGDRRSDEAWRAIPTPGSSRAIAGGCARGFRYTTPAVANRSFAPRASAPGNHPIAERAAVAPDDPSLQCPDERNTRVSAVRDRYPPARLR